MIRLTRSVTKLGLLALIIPLATPFISVLQSASPVTAAAQPIEYYIDGLELNKKYVYSRNERVTISFSKLPDQHSHLKITEVKLSLDQRLQFGTDNDTGYEFTSNMTNGTFEYTMTLPSTAASESQVKYTAGLSNLNQENILNMETTAGSDGSVVITGDHFTVFVVTDDDASKVGGTWIEQNSRGSGLDPTNGIHYPSFTTDTGSATWAMTGLTAGSYDVFVSWTTHPNRTQTAEYTVNHTVSDSYTVNQELLADQSTTGTNGQFSGWYRLGNFALDSSSTVVLPTKDNTGGSEYVIADEVLVVNGTNTGNFIGSPRYVRENNGSDRAAQVHVDNRIDDVRFYVNGTGPIAGTYINAVNATKDRWRLLTSLAAGEYTVTAEVQIAGEWYLLDDSGIVYSLDLPTFSYIYPSTDQYFRPGDNPIRVRVDDEYNQFESVTLRIYDYSAGTRGALLATHQVNRADCNLTNAGTNVRCDINDSATWANLPEGRYQADARTDTLANNGVRYGHSNSDSEPFYIDGTKPVSSLSIDTTLPAPFTIYSDTLAVSSLATDTFAWGVRHVEFYLRTPRISDGACVDNNATGPRIKLFNDVNDGDATYSHTFSTTDLNGDYCVFAKAEDLARNHSVAAKSKVSFDNIAPVVTVTNPSDSDHVNGTVDIRGSFDDVNPLRYYLVVRNSGGTVVAGPGTVYVGTPFTDQSLYSWDTTLIPDGEYLIHLAARDAAGIEIIARAHRIKLLSM